MPSLHLAKAGHFTDANGTEVEFTAADLAASARAYDPATHEAPIVIGHPKQTAPAYGWIKSLAFAEGDLVAEPHQLQVEFAELMQTAYKKRSARFYTPTSPRNPVPGVYYLRDVGVLGAMPPAIKGLRDVEFSEDSDGDTVEIAFSEPSDAGGEPVTPPPATQDSPQAETGVMDASGGGDSAAPTSVDPTDQSTDPPTEPPTEPAMPTPDLDTREAALAAREAELAKREAEAARREHLAFAETLKQKLHPSQQPLVVELLCYLDGSPEDLEFAEGDATVQRKPVDALKALLNALPPLVEFGEVATGDTVDFSEDPVGLAAAARAYQAEQSAKGITISAAEAVAKVKK